MPIVNSRDRPLGAIAGQGLSFKIEAKQGATAGPMWRCAKFLLCGLQEPLCERR